MKYLKIEKDKGYFYNADKKEFHEISEINKDDLLFLLDKCILDDFEMDPFEENKIANKAHQIIYKNLFEKFTQLLSNKTRFEDECNLMFREAIEKYK